MWQSSSFRLHPAPCYTPVGSAQMGGHCAKLRESVTFSILLKDGDKGRVNCEWSTLPPAQISQVSTAATVSLTLRSYPCWYSAWAMFAALFCFIVKDVLHSNVKWPLGDFFPFGSWSFVEFSALFILFRLPLPWIATLLAPPSQKSMQGRQSNPTQETSQPVIAGSRLGGRVLIFFRGTPRTT